MNDNPFNLMYGLLPNSIVNRDEDYNKIVQEFNRNNPSTYSYIITGVRGSGKTVLLREIANNLEKDGWIVLDINPQGDIVSSVAQKMFYEGNKYKLFLDWKLTIDLKYIQLEISKNNYINDPEVIFEHLLSKANKNNKKVLITIDEVNNTQALRLFANTYQSMIGKKYNVYLLMTGLKDNVDALLNSKAASFLSRTPKIDLKPLDIIEIAHKYHSLLNVNEEFAIRLAKLTKGYAFAYQVLGYICYETHAKDINDELIRAYDNLRNNGYDVVWKNLTEKERELCIAIAMNIDDNSKNILELSNMKMSNYQNYRNKLIQQGIIYSDGYGKIAFTLPRFKDFVLLMQRFAF